MLPSSTVVGTAPLTPCCLVYAGPTILNPGVIPLLSYTYICSVDVLNQISPFLPSAGWLPELVTPDTATYPCVVKTFKI